MLFCIVIVIVCLLCFARPLLLSSACAVSSRVWWRYYLGDQAAINAELLSSAQQPDPGLKPYVSHRRRAPGA